MTAQVDHLVVGASSLEEGVDWCQRTLGITPGQGGEHPLMGTHNRLFSIATAQHPNAYFEIIAIDSRAACARQNGLRRWFDLDDRVLAEQLKQSGPQLIHFVAGTPAVRPAMQALALLDIDRGELLEASRRTEKGLLSWQITVRNDGQRLLNGTLPTLIEWGSAHPSAGMAASGVVLQSLTASQPDTKTIKDAYAAIDMQGVAVVQGPARLMAVLQTPRGLVTLASSGV